jgi:hypothetical protein
MAPQEDQQKDKENLIEINAEKLAKLDAIADVPANEYARKAEEIGALQTGTVDKLEATYTNHAADFERKVNEEVAMGTPKPMALKLVFNDLYVPAEFIDAEPLPENSDLMSFLGRSVKKEEQAGMAEDESVRALAVRLDALTSKRAQTDVKTRMQKNEQDKRDADEESRQVDEKYEPIAQALGDLGTIDIGNQLTPLSEELKTGTDPNSVKTRLKTAIGGIYDPVNSLGNNNALANLYPDGSTQFKDICENHRALVLHTKNASSDDLSETKVKDFIGEHQKFIETVTEFLNAQEAQRASSKAQKEARITQLKNERGEMHEFAGTAMEKNMEAEVVPFKTERDEVDAKRGEANAKRDEFKERRDEAQERIKEYEHLLTPEIKEAKKRIGILDQKLADYETENSEIPAKTSEIEERIVYLSQLAKPLKAIKNDLGNLEKQCKNDNLVRVFRKIGWVETAARRVQSENKDRLPNELKILCQGFIDIYSKELKPLESSFINSEPVDRDKILAFVEGRVGTFIEEFFERTRVLEDSALEEIDKLLPRLVVKVEKAQNELLTLEDVVTDFNATGSTPANPEVDALEAEYATAVSEISGLDGNLAKLDAQIAELDAKIAQMEGVTPKQRILSKAVPQVDPIELDAAEEEMEDTRDRLTELKKTRKYFSKPGNRQKVLKSNAAFEKNYGDDDGNVALGTEIQRLEGVVQDLGRTLEKGADIPQPLTDARNDKARLKALKTASKNLHDTLKDFAKHVSRMIEAGVIDSPAGADINEILSDLESVDPTLDEFTANEVKNIYNKLEKFFGSLEYDDASKDFGNFRRKFAVSIAGYKKEADLAKKNHGEMEKADKENHLTKFAAIKQAVKALLKEQNPDIDEEELERRATLTMINDRMTIKTLDSYEKIAKNGSAELFEAANEIDVSEKLLAMELKEPGSEKVERPFQGYKAEQITNISELENLVLSDKKFIPKGFIVLAAYERSLGDTEDVRPIRLRKALKTALVRRDFPAAEDYLYVPKIEELVDKAFEMELAEGQRKFNTWSEHYDTNKPIWDSSLVKKLNEDYARIAKKHDHGDISDQMLAQEQAKLLKEARDGGVQGQVSFAMDSAMASHSAKWMQDFGHKAGVDATEAGKAVGMMGVDAAVGATGQVAKRGFRFGKFLTAPLWWAIKYPAIGAAKIAALPRHVFNFFVPERWQIKAPFQGVWGKFKADAGRAGETGKSVYSGMLGEIKDRALSAIKGRWGKRKPEYKSRAERDEFDADASKAKSDEYAEGAKRTPAELPAAETVDFSEIKARIDKLVITEVQSENSVAGEKATGS